jgi:ubiquitin carboxyl-terminal hydrolase 10
VYHDGEDAHKGHYVVDCFHPSGGSMWGPWGWLRHDDTSVKPVSEANMLNPAHPRVPYLLFYRRQDTIVQQQQKKGS